MAKKKKTQGDGQEIDPNTLKPKALTEPKRLSKELRNIRYLFTKEELEGKSRQLANACTAHDSLEQEKKTVNSDYKAKIEAQISVIKSLSNHISNGYEMKNVECEVEKDFEKGVKNYLYNGQVYDSVTLSDHDRQTELNLQTANATKAKEKEKDKLKPQSEKAEKIPGSVFKEKDWEDEAEKEAEEAELDAEV